MINKTDQKLHKVILPLFLITMFSCIELVRNEFPDFESFPTVNSILIEGETLSVHVSWAGGLNSLPLPIINDAIIDLYINGAFREHLEYTGDGIYTSKTIIEPRKEYKCKIIIPTQDTIICSQTLPYPDSIINVEHINIAGRDEEGTTYSAIKITFKNDLFQRKYYEITINGIQKNDFEGKIVHQTVWMSAITDPVILNEGLPIALFSNEIIDDSIYTITLNKRFGSIKKSGTDQRTIYPYIVELRSVSYDYYRYKKQFYLYEQGTWANGLTNTTTPSPLYSNIENGNGIFAGYSVFASDTITPEPYED